MCKLLSEMSLEELWQLFPIFLVEHKKEWEQWYECESKRIVSLIPQETIKRISHIGSTSIPHIWAKNIVDILLEVEKQEELIMTKNILFDNGWLCMNQSATRITMNKGYTPNGFDKKVFHLHIRLSGDNDELYFRDYLIETPEIVKEYETLKLSLWKVFEHDRDGYTEAKSDFVKKYTNIAKKQYPMRY